jgi:uncharacterized protein (TIGR03118 family)
MARNRASPDFTRRDILTQEAPVHLSASRCRSVAAGTAIIALAVAGCSSDNSITNSVSPLNNFASTTLVSDVSGQGAVTIDGNVVNPWGIAFGPTGILWVANNGTGTSTLYDANGSPFSLVPSIPGTSFLSAGQPTGIVLNTTSSFGIAGGPAIFLFASLDGGISAWNQSANDARLVVNRAANGSVFTGIAIATTGTTDRLYADDFANGQVDMFDGSFNFVGSFTDPSLPSDYGPFGIKNVNGRLFVTYAKRGADGNEVKGGGNGFVVIFNADGTVASRFASNGNLNDPWAIAMAPSGFGAFAGDVLIGNFGDGTIAAFDPTTGAFIDFLRDANKNVIAIDGLWGVAFGPGSGSTTLYFAAGIDDETHGIVGVLRPQ